LKRSSILFFILTTQLYAIYSQDSSQTDFYKKYNRVTRIHAGYNIVAIKQSESASDTFDGVFYKDIFKNEPIDTTRLFKNYRKSHYEYYLKDKINLDKTLYQYAYKGRNLLIQKDSINNYNIIGFHKLEYLYGIIDEKGNEILPIIYNKIYYNDEVGLIYYNYNEYYGIMNHRFQKIVELKNTNCFDHFYPKFGKIKVVQIENSYYIYDDDGILYGYEYPTSDIKYIIDTNLNYIVKPDTYASLEIISSDLNLINGQLYRDSFLICKDTFEDVEFCEDNLLLVRKNKKYGFINRNGKLIVPYECNWYDSYVRKYFPVYRDTNVFYYDREGQLYDLRAKYKNLNFDSLPRYTITYGDTNYMYRHNKNFHLKTYYLKNDAPNGYYTIIFKFKNGRKYHWNEGYYIESMEHREIKRFSHNQLNVVTKYNLGVKLSEKITNVKMEE